MRWIVPFFDDLALSWTSAADWPGLGGWPGRRSVGCRLRGVRTTGACGAPA